MVESAVEPEITARASVPSRWATSATRGGLRVDPTHAPTRNKYLAAKGEPEMISEREQERQTAAAHRREQQRKVAGWKSARKTLLTGLSEAQQALGRSHASELRVVQRQVNLIDRRLG